MITMAFIRSSFAGRRSLGAKNIAWRLASLAGFDSRSTRGKKKGVCVVTHNTRVDVLHSLMNMKKVLCIYSTFLEKILPFARLRAHRFVLHLSFVPSPSCSFREPCSVGENIDIHFWDRKQSAQFAKKK